MSNQRIRKTPTHPDLTGTTIDLSRLNLFNPENIIRRLIEALPAGWHATMLPSHLIKDDKRKIPSGRLMGRSVQS